MTTPSTRTVSLEQEQYEHLQAIAQSQQKSLAVILREIVAIGIKTLQALPKRKERRKQALAELVEIRATLSEKYQGNSDLLLAEVREERSARMDGWFGQIL